MAIITLECQLCGDTENFADSKFKINRILKIRCGRCRQRTLEEHHKSRALLDRNWGCQT